MSLKRTSKDLSVFMFLFGLALLSLSACGPKLPTLHKLTSLPQEKTCRIAVLPFLNQTGYPEANAIFYRIFLAELVQSGRFDIVQEGDVRDVFHHLRVWPGHEPQKEQMKILGDRLGVKIVIAGTVVEMAEVPEAKIINPTLAVSLKILDTESSQTIWCTFHRREGGQYRKVMHFGVVNTVTGLAHRVSQEILELWFKEGLKGCIG